MKLAEKYKSIATTIFWWPILVLNLLCFALLVSLLPVRMRNGAALRAVSSVLLKAAGVRVQVQGLQNIIRERSQILVANHESWFDSFLLISVLPIPITFVSKKEMFRVPIYNHIMRRLRFVRVDRVNPRDDLRNIDSITALLQSQLSLMVFPEGTMSRTGKLGSFKRGAVLLAAKADVPVIPIAVIGTRNIKTPDSPLIHFGVQTKVIISEPVEVAGMEREEQRTAMKEIRAIIERYLTDADKHAGGKDEPCEN